MEEKFVYVIYDLLYERIVCVHNQPDKVCKICKKIKADKEYQLEEQKHLIQTKYK